MNWLKQLVGTFGMLSMVLFLDPSLPPRPLPPPTPVAEISSGAIRLIVTDVLMPSATPWTRVQWQAGDGTWVTADGWQGSLETSVFLAENNRAKLSGVQMWTVGDALYGQTDFRWQLLTAADGAVVATSDTFDLPVRDGEIVQVMINSTR